MQDAVRTLKVGYPVAVDSDYRIWEAFGNQYWPALYFIDAKGHIRHHYFGEGNTPRPSASCSSCLKESGASGLDESVVRVAGEGVEAAPSGTEQTPETYVGYRRGESYASPERQAKDAAQTYGPPGAARAEPMGLGRIVEHRPRKRRARGRGWPDRLPVPQPRPALRPGSGEGGTASSIQGDAGRRRSR